MYFVILQMSPVQPGRYNRESATLQFVCLFFCLMQLDNFHGKHTYNMPKYTGEEKQVVPLLIIRIHVSIYEDTLSGYEDLRGSLLHCRRKQAVSELIKPGHACYCDL